MRVLVTGAAGFIGSNLVEYLLKQDYKVRGVDDFSTGFPHNLPKKGTTDWEFIEGDIRNPQVCRRAVHKVDGVVHLAARNSVPRSLADPRSAFTVNIQGTFELLEAIRAQNLRFVFASSSSVYGDDPHSPKVERTRLLPRSPYAATKASCEMLVRSWARCWGVKAIGLRFFNVFGPRQDPNSAYSAVIPLFIKAALKNTPAIIHGDGSQSRDFTYVGNVVKGVECALKAPPHAFGQMYNIACGDSIRLLRVYQTINHLMNCSVSPIFSAPRTGDVPHSLADIGMARRDLNYRPTVFFDEGIRMTLAWYRDEVAWYRE